MLLVNLGGCAGSYTCNEYPTGRCQSVSEVYDKTNKKRLGDSPKPTEKLDLNQNSKKGDAVLNSSLLGSPILKEPIVMRVLLNYWEDEDQDLNMGGYIFVKVKDSEWEIH